MYKTYKFRIYPTEEQKEFFEVCFNGCRLVYNKLLEYHKEIYDTTGKTLSKYDYQKYCTSHLKKIYPWLYNIPSNSLQQIALHLHIAFKKFFTGDAGYPKFKSSKESKKSFTYDVSQIRNVLFEDSSCIFVSKLGLVKTVFHRKVKGEPRIITISKTGSNKYFASVLSKEEYIPINNNSSSIGISLGIYNIVSTSNGEFYGNLCINEKNEHKVALLQQALNLKVENSNNYEKQKIKLARCHERAANQRKEYIHRLSHNIVSNYGTIYLFMPKIERYISSKSELSKKILDASMFELFRQIAYKCSWNNRTLYRFTEDDINFVVCPFCGTTGEITDYFASEYKCSCCNKHSNMGTNLAKSVLLYASSNKEVLKERLQT